MSKETKKTSGVLLPGGGIGEGPTGNRPRNQAPKSVEDSKSTPEQKVEDSTKEAQKPTSPKTYAERLAEAGLTLEEARKIQDTLLFERQYIKEVQLSPSFSIRLASRRYGDTTRLLRALEAERPSFAVHTDDLMARYNIAASLEGYGSRSFTPRDFSDASKDEDAFQERLEFVRTLPDVTVRRISHALAKFDNELAAVLSDGAVGDF